VAQDRATGHLFAVKEAKVRQRDQSEKRFCEELWRELEICRDLRHHHIVSYLGYSHDGICLQIFFEYVPGGSLRNVLNQFGALDGLLLQKAVRGVLFGLNYLHTHQPPVVHRDLKGANILVDPEFCVKLADFGCAKKSRGTQSMATVGSLHWMAPEVIQKERGHGRKADIWSLGCVVVEMGTASDPWGKDTFDNIIHAMNIVGFSNATPTIPEEMPYPCRALVALCLNRLPDKRPSSTQLLDHEFVQEVAGEEAAESAAAQVASPQLRRPQP